MNIEDFKGLIEEGKRLREADLQALESYKSGKAEPPIIYKAEGYAKTIETGQPMMFVASEETEDRLGDKIATSGWQLDSFHINPVYMWVHDYSIAPLGIVPKVWVEGGQLLNLVDWDEVDEFAQFIKGKYHRKILRAESVGFRAIEYENNSNGGINFLKQELLEISAVPIPAHPKALAKAMVGRFQIVMPTFPREMKMLKGVIGWASAHPDGTPAAEREAEWDAAQESAAAEVDDLKIMCAWVDSENTELKTAYKFPHHMAGGDHPVVYRALAASVAVLNGGRGGADIPDADRRGVYRHIARHYSEDYDEEAPELRKMEDLQKDADEMASIMSQMKEHMSALVTLMDDMAGAMKGQKAPGKEDLGGVFKALQEITGGVK